MVVENTTVYLVMGLMGIYIMVYNTNKIIGSILYIALSVATIAFATNNSENAIGIILLGASIISSIYAILKKA